MIRQPSPVSLEAIVFDFDGIIVDSEPVHFEAYQAVLKPMGLGFSWDDYRNFYMGFDDRDAIRKYFQRTKRELPAELLNEIASKKAAVFPNLAAKARPFPGVIELIRASNRKLKTALCSGAVRTDIEPVIERLGIAKYFQAIVTADEVKTSKPDPESYRLILKKLTRKIPRLVSPSKTRLLESPLRAALE